MTEASLNIELNVDCPECHNYIDLLTVTHLNDDGWLLGKVCPSGDWSESHRKFECSVKCPDCGEDFNVEGIRW